MNHAGGPVGYQASICSSPALLGSRSQGSDMPWLGRAQSRHGLHCRRLDGVRPDRECLRWLGSNECLSIRTSSWVCQLRKQRSRFRIIGSYWSMIKAKWSAGDWVMIQFGHNDKTDSDATVQANLEKMAADAQTQA